MYIISFFPLVGRAIRLRACARRLRTHTVTSTGRSNQAIPRSALHQRKRGSLSTCNHPRPARVRYHRYIRSLVSSRSAGVTEQRMICRCPPSPGRYVSGTHNARTGRPHGRPGPSRPCRYRCSLLGRRHPSVATSKAESPVVTGREPWTLRSRPLRIRPVRCPCGYVCSGEMCSGSYRRGTDGAVDKQGRPPRA